MDILTVNGDLGRYPASYYAATAHPFEAAAAPAGEIRCDVCIVGGGFTGVSSALHLARRGYRVVLLEAHRIGWGASGRNGGQVNTGMRLDQPALEEKYGHETAYRLWTVAVQAVDLVKGLIAVLIRLLDGLPYSEIQDFSIRDTLAKLGLNEALSSQRTNGLMSMVERLKRATA